MNDEERDPLPNPGSNEAIKLGCKCPVMDNGRGWGYRIKGQFVTSELCKLHWNPAAFENPLPKDGADDDQTSQVQK